MLYGHQTNWSDGTVTTINGYHLVFLDELIFKSTPQEEQIGQSLAMPYGIYFIF